MKAFIRTTLSAAVLAWCAGANAQNSSSIEIQGPAGGLFQTIWNTGQNIIGLAPGVADVFGAVSICAGGVANISDRCAQPNSLTVVTATRNGANLGTVGNAPFDIAPNYYARGVTWTGQTGAVTLNISHPGYPSISVNTPTLVGASVVPLADSVTVSYASGPLTPTFTWRNPSNVPIDNVRVLLYDTTQRVAPGAIGTAGLANLIFRKDLGANATTFTLNPGAAGLSQSLQVGRQYALGIQEQDLRDPSLTGSGDNTLSLSQAYVNFTIGANSGISPVYLPTLLPGTTPVFSFNIGNIVANQTYSIDPDVAIGYDYRIGAGNPNFASVSLPTGLAPGNQYNLLLWNGSQWVAAGSILGGVAHSFGGGGVDRFRITGIPVSANLDPYSPTAFVTDLTFTGAGSFTGTMIPLTAPVPEPGTWAMLAAGLGLIGTAVRRRRVASGRRGATLA